MTTEQLIAGLPSLLGTLVGGGIVLFGNYLTAKYQASLWERQMVLTEKRKLYGELLAAINNGRTALTSLELRLGHNVLFADTEPWVQQIKAAYDELDRLWPTIQIFSGPELQAAHGKFISARQTEPLRKPEAQWCKDEADAFVRFQLEVAECARTDLSIKRGIERAK